MTLSSCGDVVVMLYGCTVWYTGRKEIALLSCGDVVVILHDVQFSALEGRKQHYHHVVMQWCVTVPFGIASLYFLTLICAEVNLILKWLSQNANWSMASNLSTLTLQKCLRQSVLRSASGRACSEVPQVEHAKMCYFLPVSQYTDHIHTETCFTQMRQTGNRMHQLFDPQSHFQPTFTRWRRHKRQSGDYLHIPWL